MEIISRVSIVLILIIIGMGVNELSKINAKATTFYEDKDKKINLKLVKHIVPKVDYIITYKEDKNVDIFRKYSTTLNENEIKNIQSFLELAQNSAFYNVEIIAYMKLDDVTVELFHSKQYLKKAEVYSVNDNMLAILRSYGIDDFQYKSLAKLKDKIYEDSKTFYEDVVAYARLKKDAWSEQNIPLLGLGDNGIKFMHNIDKDAVDLALTQEEISLTCDGLKEAYYEYERIK
jgi:hypothetical protein